MKLLKDEALIRKPLLRNTKWLRGALNKIPAITFATPIKFNLKYPAFERVGRGEKSELTTPTADRAKLTHSFAATYFGPLMCMINELVLYHKETALF